MSQTPLTITVDVADILKEISGKLDNLQRDSSEMKTEMKVMHEKLSGQISTLNEKVDGLAKRIDNQEFNNRGILIALVIALIAGALKLFGVLPNS
ncbi:MAG: hypothetical protein N5P05_004078 (plasmid) [Chroococcopsis gigantea SAG 12.99]|jgi:lipid II:glycine glycyltransferase (peptidoglycan interpeptide bridge formation enzyme)|nr:hypothetical protein [Chroococcopsis gigantea SAG 12.99]